MHFYWEFFAGAGYSVESNKEHGEGRSDVVVHDVEQGRVAVFEVKYAKTLNDMSSQCAKALKQIQDKMYAKDYEDEYEEIDCWWNLILQETLHDQKNIRKEDKKHGAKHFYQQIF